MFPEPLDINNTKMDLHTENEIICMLRCVHSGVWEFAEIGRVALNCLSESQQRFVFDLFDSDDDDLRTCAVYAVYRQKKWTLSRMIHEKLLNIALHDTNKHIRHYAVSALHKHNASQELVICALDHLLRGDQNDIAHCINLISTEKYLVDYYYKYLMTYLKDANYIDIPTDFFVQHGIWDRDVEQHVQYLISSNSFEDVLAITNTIDIPVENFIKLVELSLKSATNFSSLAKILDIAGKKKLVCHILPAVLKKIDECKWNDWPSEWGDFNNDNIIELGISVSKYIVQFDHDFEQHWSNGGETSRGVLLACLLHSRKKVQNLSLVKCIINTAIASSLELNIALGIALCHYYKLPFLSHTDLLLKLLDSDNNTVCKLVLWIARQNALDAFCLPKQCIKMCQRNEASGHETPQELWSNLLLLRRQYRQMTNLIDNTLSEFSVTRESQACHLSEFETNLYIHELQKSSNNALFHLTKYASKEISSRHHIQDDESKLFEENW